MAGALYHQYGALIRARCRRLLNDDAKAEDATQEVFLRVVRHLERAPNTAEALRWMYRIAANYCLNEIRDEKRRTRLGASCIDDVDDVDTSAGEDTRSARDLARRIVERVPDRLALPALLHHVNGMSHREVGRALGLSRRTIITYIAEFRARALRLAAKDS